MVRTFLKVYMELCSYFLFLQEQIKDIIINSVVSDIEGECHLLLEVVLHGLVKDLDAVWDLQSGFHHNSRVVYLASAHEGVRMIQMFGWVVAAAVGWVGVWGVWSGPGLGFRDCRP